MPIIFAKAPGKIILFGEHAVVYGHPAIAIPVNKVNATARVFPNFDARPGDVHIQAPDIQLDALLADLPEGNPIARAIQLTLEAIFLEQPPSFTLQISSSIPIAGGMGSSAAISIAIIRAISDFFGHPLSPDQVSGLAYEIEKIHHGTPSGIDNHVIAHQKPVFFVRGEPIQYLTVEHPTHWVIADTGEKTPTRETVSELRARHDAHPGTYDRIFEQIADITQQARQALIYGDISQLGNCMDENQHLLEELGVSCHSLERLIAAAKDAGAAGAKLSGGGRGGNIIALSPTAESQQIQAALYAAGARQVITTTLARGVTS